MDKIFRSPIQDPNISIMALHGTPANKAAASGSNAENAISQGDSGSDLSQGNLDSDNNGGDGSGTLNATPQPKTIGGHISGALALYTKT